jgi:hypothetical protein
MEPKERKKFKSTGMTIDQPPFAFSCIHIFPIGLWQSLTFKIHFILSTRRRRGVLFAFQTPPTNNQTTLMVSAEIFGNAFLRLSSPQPGNLSSGRAVIFTKGAAIKRRRSADKFTARLNLVRTRGAEQM